MNIPKSRLNLVLSYHAAEALVEGGVCNLNTPLLIGT